MADSPPRQDRPICFRAWHEGRKAWLHDGKPPSGGCHILGETIWAFGEWCRVPLAELNDVVVEQFTGLVDKNGVEIYEGDIVRETWQTNNPYGYSSEDWDDRDRIFEVKYVAPGFTLEEECGDGGQYCVRDFRREVIGNLHETPELLKP